MASSSAVRLLGFSEVARLCSCSILEVKGLSSSARLLKLMRKNSSFGLDFCRKRARASREGSILSAMLSLTSKRIPMEAGRSEERRVGKGCGLRWSQRQEGERV